VQCPGWRWDGGVGHTGPLVTEATGPAGLMSQRSPGQAWSRRPSPLRGLRRPLSRARRVSRTEWAIQCHRTGASHAAQRRTVAGMASPGELAE
jgi:hypothetical protein